MKACHLTIAISTNMRVTGGSKKGSRLLSLKGLDIRPTSDKVKEAIFNLLGQDLEGFYVLDLFAGTGGLGIEALSRGAGQAVFIDHSVKTLRLIKMNLEKCGFINRGVVTRKDLARGLPTGQHYGSRPFDLVFMDPPYGRGLIPPLLKQLAERKWLGPEGLVITESQRKEVLPEQQNGLTLMDSRHYGETKINRYIYGE